MTQIRFEGLILGRKRDKVAWRSRACVLAAIAVGALFAWAPGAAAELNFCPPGSAAGQCEKPEGVAVDFASEHVYVADRANNRIDVFDAKGTFLLAFGWGVRDGKAELQSCGPKAPSPTAICLRGLAGGGAGQFERASFVAVDNDPASASNHDIYVGESAENAGHRVQKFDPEGHFLLTLAGTFDDIVGVGIASAGHVYIADTKDEGPCKTLAGDEEFKKRVQAFDEAGKVINAVEPSGAPCGQVTGFAVDSLGDFYLANQGGSDAIRRYDASASLVCQVDEGVETTALDVDPEERLFSAQREKEFVRLVTEYDSGCHHLRRFGYGTIQRRVLDLAALRSAEGDVFASEEEKGIDYLSIPPPGPVVASADANPVGSAQATLNAEINPEGKATEYHFEYVDQHSFETEGGFASSHTKSTPETPLPVEGDPEEFRLHLAQALAGCPDPLKEATEEGKCLLPETTYRFRIVVKNADGKGNSPFEGEPFTTRPPVEFGSLWSSEVGVDGARLSAEINPVGIPTTGYFQYVDEATFEKNGFEDAIAVPAVSEGEAPVDFGGGESFIARSEAIFPLASGTTYHYRLVVEDPLLKESLTSPEEGIFTTFIAKQTEKPCPANEAFRSGLAALLPDCRAYEMVSPLDKKNGDILVLKTGSPGAPAVLNQSAVSGSRLAYGSFRAFDDARSGPFTSQYVASRGGGGWQTHNISPPQGRLVYSFFGYDDTPFKAFSPDLCESWLLTPDNPTLAPSAVENYPNLYRGVDGECGGSSYEALTPAEPPHIPIGDEHALRLELQGVSDDGSTAIYVAPDNLPGTGAPDLGGNQLQLYVWAGGPLPVFVCYLPSGEALPKKSCSGGTAVPGGENSRSADLQGAISADGQRVFWTAYTNEGNGGGAGQIYLREHPEQGHTTGECIEAAKPCTIPVSREGEELSGTTKVGSRFLAAAADGSRAIFRTGQDLYEFDVEPEAATLIAHHAAPGGDVGILGASADATHVYFTSTDVLGGENSENEVAETGQPNLYLWDNGTVQFIGTLSPEDIVVGNPSPIDKEPRYHLARVSPDGAHAVFMSTAPLTGYDNVDAVSGEADTEVFLYDAQANGGGGQLICASCNPSGSRPAGANINPGGIVPFWAAGAIPPYENALYGARVLSEDGKRLFFESADSLVPRDTNGARDVYEWEAPGTGGCDEGRSTFSRQDEGCVDLVSSGESAKASEFVDASPSGHDVFFTTLSSLLPQDFGLVDVYDARADGGLPPPPPPKEECEGEACQSPPEPAQAPTPASSAIGGRRQTLPKERACGKGRRSVVRKGKTRCVPKAPRKHRHRKGKGR